MTRIKPKALATPKKNGRDIYFFSTNNITVAGKSFRETAILALFAKVKMLKSYLGNEFLRD